MAINLKSQQEIDCMRTAGQLAAEVLDSRDDVLLVDGAIGALDLDLLPLDPGANSVSHFQEGTERCRSGIRDRRIRTGNS